MSVTLRYLLHLIKSPNLVYEECRLWIIKVKITSLSCNSIRHTGLGKNVQYKAWISSTKTHRHTTLRLQQSKFIKREHNWGLLKKLVTKIAENSLS
jgi:hypothetical protein